MKHTQLRHGRPLKRYTPLVSYRGLNPVSERQKLINTQWKAITDQKAKDLGYICQRCHLPGTRTQPFNPLDGHHILKRRFQINTYWNCYVCHRFCHQFIENNNIKVTNNNPPLTTPKNII